MNIFGVYIRFDWQGIERDDERTTFVDFIPFGISTLSYNILFAVYIFIFPVVFCFIKYKE